MVKGKKAFTMLELMATLVILSLLTAFSVASYRRYQDHAAVLTDQTNQKVLAAAAKLYAYDNNALPGSLSQLRPEDLRRAYALVTAGKRSYTFLAYLKEMWGGEIAEAVPLPPRYYNSDLRVIICPSDPTPPSSLTDNQHRSYGIHPDAAGKSLSWLINPDNAKNILVWETKDDGKTPEARHNGGKLVVSTTVSGKHPRDEDPDKDKDKGGSK